MCATSFNPCNSPASWLLLLNWPKVQLPQLQVGTVKLFHRARVHIKQLTDRKGSQCLDRKDTQQTDRYSHKACLPGSFCLVRLCSKSTLVFSMPAGMGLQITRMGKDSHLFHFPPTCSYRSGCRATMDEVSVTGLKQRSSKELVTCRGLLPHGLSACKLGSQ